MSLKMKYGDKEFYVYTNRREKSSEGYDDYQLDEIQAAVEAYVNKRLPGGSIVSLKLGSEALCTSDFLDTYFDGDNLEEILEKCGSHIEMVFVDTDFSKTDLPKWFYDHNTEPEFTSFDTVEHRNEFLHKMEKSKSFEKEEMYQKYAPYITDYIKISNGRTIRRDVRIQKKDEFEYCFFPSAEQENYQENYQQSSARDCVECTESSLVGKTFAAQGKEELISRPLSGAYCLDSSRGEVWIYYPLCRIKEYDLGKIGIAWCSNRTVPDIARADVCGEYAVFYLPGNEGVTSFMLVDNTDK